jgi:excisionase family DNA binding protein
MSQPIPQEEEWLSLTDAATQLGVHPATLRRWANEGKIAVMITPGGHRRFLRGDVLALGQTQVQPRPASVEQVWAQQALTQTRQELQTHQHEHWLARQTGTEREEMRLLGRRLMGVLMQYIALADDDHGRGPILAEANTLGEQYGRYARQQQISLSEALQATMFFRDTLVEAAIELPTSARTHTEANSRLLRRISTILNHVQLAVARAYES